MTNVTFYSEQKLAFILNVSSCCRELIRQPAAFRSAAAPEVHQRHHFYLMVMFSGKERVCLLVCAVAALGSRLTTIKGAG